MQTPAIHPLWCIEQSHFDPQTQRHWETILTTGNGFFCTRGVLEEGYPGEERAAFMHGIFDDVPVHFTELVNLPDALELEIFLNGERFSLEWGHILAFHRWLDLRTGVLERDVCWRSPHGRTTRLHFARFISLADPHLMIIRFSIHPLDYQGEIEVRAGLSGEADNLQYKHWEWQAQETTSKQAWLACSTRKTKLNIALGTHLHIESRAALEQTGWDVRNHPVLVARTFAAPESPIQGEKIVYIYSCLLYTSP
ncbi:MAG: glycoside hydrolase family 65 protein, partial [Thermanaerothrix sp.]|nr:glycoside hydrolase family 65 protein [Thermanaerothrix sp.]